MANEEQLRILIQKAMQYADRKCRPDVFVLSKETMPEKVERLYSRRGRQLFWYFKDHVDDPPYYVIQISGKPYHLIAQEMFRQWKSDRIRINASLRDQYLKTLFLKHLKADLLTCFTDETIARLTIEALLAGHPVEKLFASQLIPERVLATFGSYCRKLRLIDDTDCFRDPDRLLYFFTHHSLLITHHFPL